MQFKEDGATYAYLTGGISLKAGDFVVVPIGDHQAEKLARVTEVFVCSTQNAPYPPEKAKFVLRKSERTAFPERKKPQHPAPKQADVSAPTESKRAVPPVQSAPTANPQKSAPTVQSAITPPIVSQTPTEPEITEKKSTLSKKPFPLGKLIAAVLAVAVIAWVSISVSDRSKQRAAAYCHSHQPKGEYTEVIYAFTYYETPIGRPNSAPAWTPPSTSGSSNSGSVRDDYDNPEDLWEDNQDWYEDEDEAWDEWENG